MRVAQTVAGALLAITEEPHGAGGHPETGDLSAFLKEQDSRSSGSTGLMSN